MESRDTESGVISHFLYLDRFAEIVFEPVDRLGDLVAMVAAGDDTAQSRALLTLQKPVVDLTLNLWSQSRYVGWCVQ